MTKSDSNAVQNTDFPWCINCISWNIFFLPNNPGYILLHHIVHNQNKINKQQFLNCLEVAVFVKKYIYAINAWKYYSLDKSV